MIVDCGSDLENSLEDIVLSLLAGRLVLFPVGRISGRLQSEQYSLKYFLAPPAAHERSRVRAGPAAGRTLGNVLAYDLVHFAHAGSNVRVCHRHLDTLTCDLVCCVS